MKQQYINDMVTVYRSDNNKVLTTSFGTFDSFLAGLDRNRVYSAFCNAPQLLFDFGTFDSFLAGLGWAEMEYTVYLKHHNHA